MNSVRFVLHGLAGVGLLLAPLAGVARAGAVELATGGISAGPCSGAKHCTDGAFNLHTGGSPTLDGPEWEGPNVTELFFPVVGLAGGAVLYAEQGSGAIVGDDTLYLMYDYVNGTSPGSFFDVFFEDKRENTDYGVHIQGTTLTAYEKGVDDPSPKNPDGSFNFTAAPWSLVTDPLGFTRFQGAVGFGPSPNSAANHLMAEFQLSINRAPAGSPPTGIYSPDPAFWGASTGGGGVSGGEEDPPISSGIFTLNPDGSTVILPVLGNDGAPLQEGDVPEPSTWLLIPGGLALLLARRRRG